MFGFVGFAGNFITNLLPVYLASERKLADDDVTLIAGLPLACGSVACIVGGLLSDWVTRCWKSRNWGRRLVAMVGLTAAGLSILAIPWVDAVWSLAVLFSVWFSCNDLNLGPAWQPVPTSESGTPAQLVVR